MEKIVVNFWDDFIVSPYSNEMENKYWRKFSITIVETARYLLDNNIEKKLIKEIFYGDIETLKHLIF